MEKSKKEFPFFLIKKKYLSYKCQIRNFITRCQNFVINNKDDHDFSTCGAGMHMGSLRFHTAVKTLDNSKNGQTH